MMLRNLQILPRFHQKLNQIINTDQLKSVSFNYLTRISFNNYHLIRMESVKKSLTGYILRIN